MKALCTICMRGGSKGVPGKNIRLLNGKPLMEYTIQQAIESNLFENIVISTDSEKIASNVRSMGLDVWFLRPKKYSADKAPKIPVIIHALRKAEKYFKKEYPIIVDLDVTSPLREVRDISRAMEQFNSSKCSNLVTACKARKNPYFNMLEKKGGEFKLIKESKEPFSRRQDAPEVYDMNASIYIWSRSYLLANKPLISKDTSCYIMPEERSVDIDSELDFSYVEFLINKG